MKRVKFITMLTIAFCTALCTACSGRATGENIQTPNDSIVSAALGDSIFNILKNAKTVTAEIIGYNDTAKRVTQTAKLSKERIEVIKFLLHNPDNVASNDTLYGLFLPNVIFTFQYKKQELKLYFDYGLGKWQINDATDKPLMMFDLKSREFLRLAQAIFPNDEYFNKLIKKLGL